MEPARWNQIEELLQAALDLEPPDRAAFLDTACSSDPELRREVDALLAHESDGGELSQFPALNAVETKSGLWTGREISHYSIGQRLGAGGMGEVYEARDDRLQRVVALKALPGEFGNDPDRVRRFEQEALSASRLNHPNIITIFEILGAEGSHFIAAERIEGQTLRQLLTDDQGKRRKLPMEQALEIAIQIATALKAAHTAWIIHRDIKPENIMVRSDGLVKVLDFGIAKLSEEPAVLQPLARPMSGSGSNLTIPGAILGTATYMSPEQARGEALDGRTDLYSLGLVFHEMLTGERPAEKGRLEAVPREIGRVIQKLLRPDREERYSSASELLDELQRVKRRFEDRTARRMVGFGALAIIVALTVAGIAAFLSVNETWDERVLRDGHTAAARQAIFSPDGTTVVSCSEDGKVIVWDFARRERVVSLNQRAHKVAYSPDGRWLATGGTDGWITIWETKRWTPLRRIQLHNREISALGFSPDGSLLAASDIEVVSLWKTSDWKNTGQWPYGTMHGTFLFSGSSLLITGSLRVIDESGVSPSFNGNNTGTGWMAMSPDGLRIGSIDTMGGVWFYSLPRPGDFRHLARGNRIPAHHDHGRAVAYSPDGQLVATGAEGILLWDPHTRSKVARFEYPSIVWSVAFSPDGRWLLSSHGDGAILVWNVGERALAASLNEHSGGVRAVAFSPDGDRIASASEDHSVVIWNAVNGKKETVLLGHTTRVMGVAFSKHPNEIVSADQGGRIIVWNVARREPRARLELERNGSLYCLAVSPDGALFASTTAVWKRDTQTSTPFPDTAWGQIYAASFSGDGRTLATAASAGELALWDPDEVRRVSQAILPGTHQVAVSMARDGTRVASGEDEGRIRLWSAPSLKQLAVLGQHAARVKAVAFSPDGKFVASAGDDKMIALWDVDRRRLHARIGTHASPIYALAFSPDGRQLVSGEHDRTVRLYTRQRTLWGMKLE